MVSCVLLSNENVSIGRAVVYTDRHSHVIYSLSLYDFSVARKGLQDLKNSISYIKVSMVRIQKVIVTYDKTYRSFTLTVHNCQINDKNTKHVNHKLIFHLEHISELFETQPQLILPPAFLHFINRPYLITHIAPHLRYFTLVFAC